MAGYVNLPELMMKHNRVIVAIYGQICIAAKSYQSAIRESLLSCAYMLLFADVVDSLFLAYSPDDPMMCLCLAIASIGRAM
jgi:hypothetical protein